MGEPVQRTRLEAWQRERLWAPLASGAVGTYLLLAILTGLAVPWRTGETRTVTIDAALCGVTALWVLVMFTVRPAWRRSAPHMGVFVAGLVVLLTALVIRNPWFGFFAVAGYGLSIKYLPWPWRQAGVAGTAFAVALSQTSGVKSLPVHLAVFSLALVLNAGATCFLSWFLWTSDRQDQERKQALVALNAANERLVATIAENDNLHQQLITQAREAGIAQERQRMAREIHDTLAQGLTGIITQLQAAEQAATQIPDKPADWQRHLTAATQLARDNLREARRSVDALRPEPLDGCSLSEALAAVAERWSALNNGIPVQVTTTGTARPVDPEAEFALLRAAQEALANVARHASATRVGLTVSYMEHEVALDVRDDGLGFDPAAVDHGFGLVAMRQRIAALSGTLQVESEPGGGTAISACVPTVPKLVRT